MRVIQFIIYAVITSTFVACSTTRVPTKESIHNKINTEEQAQLVSSKLSCIAYGMIKNKKYQKITNRVARSNAEIFLATVEPKNTELIFTQGSKKTIAKFSQQILKTPNNQFMEDLTLKGVIYDQYVSSTGGITFQYYVPAS